MFVPDEVRPCYEAMVSTHYGMYPVYGLEQATGKGEKSSSGATDRDSTPNKEEQAPSSSLPFDDGFVAKVVSEKELPPKSQLRRSKGENATCKAYFPDGFEAKDMAAIQGMEEEAAVVFHQLYLFRHVHGQGRGRVREPVVGPRAEAAGHDAVRQGHASAAEDRDPGTHDRQGGPVRLGRVGRAGKGDRSRLRLQVLEPDLPQELFPGGRHQQGAGT